MLWSKMVNVINKICEVITSAMLIMMVVILFLQIVMRELLGTSFLWISELATYLMICIVFLGCSFAVQYGSHITITLIPEKLSIRYKRMINTVILLVSFVFLTLLMIKGIVLANMIMLQKSPTLHIPKGIIYLVIPLGAVLQIISIVDVYIKELGTSVDS